MTHVGTPPDPLYVLREYRHLAPWSLRDMVALAGAILETAGVAPVNSAATPHPTERTVRFYVTRGLVTPPEGRGTAATYGYRHLLQILGIKLRQMEGATLDRIAAELSQTAGDVLERRVAAALGPRLPIPGSLILPDRDRPATGRAGRMLHGGSTGRSGAITLEAGTTASADTWHRIPVSDGIEIHINDSHPMAGMRHRRANIADAVRAAIARVRDDAGDHASGGGTDVSNAKSRREEAGQ